MTMFRKIRHLFGLVAVASIAGFGCESAPDSSAAKDAEAKAEAPSPSVAAPKTKTGIAPKVGERPTKAKGFMKGQ
jgi:hypothetical protein